MSRLVKDDGSGREPIVVVGEAPGEQEERQGKPFVGPSGFKLAGWMRAAGLDRRDAYWTNSYPFRPNAQNRIDLVPRHDLDYWIDQLHDRIAALANPVVIVPTGNVALRALVGKDKVTKHRGSIYAYRDRRGRILKVIPTIHPAAIFRAPAWERRCLKDWERIASERLSPELNLPQREHMIRPTWSDVLDYLDAAKREAEVLALDIETPRERRQEQTTTKAGKIRTKSVLGDPRITCIGFSYDPSVSLTIPTVEWYWAQQGIPLEEVWGVIRQLCELPCEKSGQNGLFDLWWLGLYNVHVTNYRWDTRWMDHCLDPLDAHDLAYQASVWTREPYWKDDRKDEDPEGEWSDNETFWKYCGKDAAVTRELSDIHHQRLSAVSRLGFYQRHYVDMYEPLLRMMWGGMRVNQRAQRLTAMRLTAECLTIADRTTEIVGTSLHGKKDLSSKKVTEYLYGTLRLPKQIDRQTKNLTAKEVVVRKLMLRFPAKLGSPSDLERPIEAIDKAGPLILLHRRKAKLVSFMKEGVVDSDGYSRCTYGFVDTLRLASRKNPRRTGQNHQNIDRELLHLYVPDSGHIFLEVDLSQAEDRVVKMLAAATTRDPRRREELMWRARAMPWENDEHKRAAHLIFNIAVEAVNKEQRYLAKRGRHASNYGMRGGKLAEELLKDGLVFAPEECDRMIDTILDRDVPEVRDWQRETRQEVLRNKSLTNSWGMVIDYTYERLNDELFRSAYAFRPQSEVTTIINRWGLIPLDAWLAGRDDARIALQKHDSLLISCVPAMAWPIARFLKASLERPRTYAGEALVIPTEFKLGRTAATDHEFKKFPGRAQFDEVAQSLVG